MKKAFRSELLEVCKTRAKKSSPDVFTFFVDLAGHDMVRDTDRSTTCWSRSRAPPLEKKGQKLKVLPKTLVSPNNRLIFSA